MGFFKKAARATIRSFTHPKEKPPLLHPAAHLFGGGASVQNVAKQFGEGTGEPGRSPDVKAAESAAAAQALQEQQFKFQKSQALKLEALTESEEAKAAAAKEGNLALKRKGRRSTIKTFSPSGSPFARSITNPATIRKKGLVATA